MSAIPTSEAATPGDLLGVYKHYKGGVYEVLGSALHTETKEEFIVYRTLSGPVDPRGPAFWVRPTAMFFESVQAGERKVARFTKVP